MWDTDRWFTFPKFKRPQERSRIMRRAGCRRRDGSRPPTASPGRLLDHASRMDVKVARWRSSTPRAASARARRLPKVPTSMCMWSGRRRRRVVTQVSWPTPQTRSERQAGTRAARRKAGAGGGGRARLISEATENRDLVDERGLGQLVRRQRLELTKGSSPLVCFSIHAARIAASAPPC